MENLLWERHRDTGFYEARGSRGHRYELRWHRYGQTGKTWQLYINNERVPLSFGSRLKDVMARANRLEGYRQ